MPQAYTEDRLVERPAIGLFAEVGWQVARKQWGRVTTINICAMGSAMA